MDNEVFNQFHETWENISYNPKYHNFWSNGKLKEYFFIDQLGLEAIKGISGDDCISVDNSIDIKTSTTNNWLVNFNRKEIIHDNSAYLFINDYDYDLKSFNYGLISKNVVLQKFKDKIDKLLKEDCENVKKQLPLSICKTMLLDELNVKFKTITFKETIDYVNYFKPFYDNLFLLEKKIGINNLMRNEKIFEWMISNRLNLTLSYSGKYDANNNENNNKCELKVGIKPEWMFSNFNENLYSKKLELELEHYFGVMNKKNLTLDFAYKVEKEYNILIQDILLNKYYELQKKNKSNNIITISFKNFKYIPYKEILLNDETSMGEFFV